MPVTPEQAHRMVAHALDARPHGAPRWDGEGVLAAIRKVSQLDYCAVFLAVHHAATDATLKTPLAISDTAHRCWKFRPPIETAPRNVPARHRCNDCGQAEDAPIHRDDHQFEQHRTAPAGATTARVDQLRAIHQEATR